MNILIVDDEPNIRKTLAAFLQTDGHDTVAVESVDKALAMVKLRVFDLAFVDLRLGADNGLDLVSDLLVAAPWLKIVVITAYAAIDTAVAAIKRGACDYVAKPFVPAQLRLLVNRLVELRNLEWKVASLQENLASHPVFLDFESSNPLVRRTLELARQAAASEAVVLLTGESGVGKTELARAIHGWSRRAARPFAVISCPSLSPELLESTLFGHVKGAFTGAVRDQAGRIAACEGGVLLLDEIGELPIGLQPKLLRFLQEKRYERVGDPVTRKADVRVVAATNTHLEQAVREKRFREDLYFRLNVIQITMPALRERPEDIESLAQGMLAHLAREENRVMHGFAPAAMALLKAHDWPGNLRELRNVVERAVILGQGPWVEVRDLPASLASQPTVPRIGDPIPLDKVEEWHIRQVLATAGSMQEAAAILGIDQTTLWRRRKLYGI